jgi:cytochrome c551/c552
MAVKRSIRIWLITVLIILIAIQFVPVTFTNPPVTNEPNWDLPETRVLVARACFNCHSNETDLPWYSTIAPASWLIYRDISVGREEMNFSEWKLKGKRVDHLVQKIEKLVKTGDMPPWYYLPLHPEAKLSADEKEQIIKGLQQTVSNSVTEAD